MLTVALMCQAVRQLITIRVENYKYDWLGTNLMCLVETLAEQYSAGTGNLCGLMVLILVGILIPSGYRRGADLILGT